MTNEKDIVKAFAALAHENRLAIFRMLIRVGQEGMTASEITSKIKVSPTACSFHLKELTNAGLIHSWRQGRYVNYAVLFEGVRALLTFLTHDCCAGKPELCSDTTEITQEFCEISPSVKHKKTQAE